MTKQVQRRRGTSTQHTSFTGAEGEISVNTTNKSIHVHDGLTAGGVEAARADLANVSDTSLNNALSGNTLASLTITSADINGGTIDGTTIGGTSPAAVTTTSLVATTADINGGTVDGAVIGGSSAAAITGTTITATGDVTIADKIIHAGDTNTAIRFPAADTVTVETAGAERLRVDSSGNVGIGTSSPDARLHAQRSDDGNILIIRGTSNAQLIAGISSGNLYYDSSNGNAVHTFRTNGTERMRIDASGNLGLGVTPSAWTTTGNQKVLDISTTASVGSDITNTFFNRNGFYNGANWIYKTTGPITHFALTGGGQFEWYTAPSGTAGNTATLTQAMALDASGNLGVGTSSPATYGRLVAVSPDNTSTTQVITAISNNLGQSVSMTFAGFRANAGAGIGFAVNGSTTNAASIDSSGNLLVGTTTGATNRRLSVVGGYIFNSTNNGHLYGNFNETANTAIWEVRGAQTKNANFGFVEAGVAERWAVGIKGGDASLIFASGSADIATATERARIDSSGNLLVGTTSSNSAFTTSGISLGPSGEVLVSRVGANILYLNRRTTTGPIVEFAYDGTIRGSISTNGTTTAYNTSSDYRLKENVQPMQDALAKIAQLNPVTYTWKADGSDGQGFIAHELQAVVPDCVSGEKDAVDAEGNPQYQGVDTSFLVATLVKAVQELTAKVASLEAQLNP